MTDIVFVESKKVKLTQPIKNEYVYLLIGILQLFFLFFIFYYFFYKEIYFIYNKYFREIELTDIEIKKKELMNLYIESIKESSIYCDSSDNMLIKFDNKIINAKSLNGNLITNCKNFI